MARARVATAAAALLAVGAARGQACGSAGDWEIAQTLDPSIEMALQARFEGDEIVVDLSARHRGWMGLGIGEWTSGSMIGADIVSAEPDNSGRGVVLKDRFVNWQSFPFAPYGGSFHYYAKDKDIGTDPSLFPVVDSQQDWSLESATLSEDGCTSVIMRRKLDTGDRFDRVLVPGEPVRIIWAHGEGTVLSYHSANRGATAIYPEAPPSAPECAGGACQVISLAFDDHVIAPQETTYVCRSFTLQDEEAHVVEIRPVIDNSKYVHHILVHICEDNAFFREHGSAKVCGETPGNGKKGVSPLSGKCSALLFAWAVGGGPLVLPDEAGFRIGAGRIQHVIVEIHYDNPAEDVGQVDATAMELVVAPTLREHDAGVILMGDVSAAHQDLAPGQPLQQRVGACPGSCTGSAFSTDINVFGSFLHMHSFGKRIWTERYRGTDSEPEELNYIEAWNFGFQQVTPVNYVLSPGDSIYTYCEYDTAKWEDTLEFGIDSLEEMCMDFIFYWPVQTYDNTDVVVCCGGSSPMEVLSNSYSDEKVWEILTGNVELQTLNAVTLCGNRENVSFEVLEVEADGETINVLHQPVSPRWNGTHYPKEFKVGAEAPAPAETVAPTPAPTAGNGGNPGDDFVVVPTVLPDGFELAYQLAAEEDESQCQVTLRIKVEGERWIGVGVDTGTGMTNSRVVIGMDDTSFAAEPVAEYAIGRFRQFEEISAHEGDSGIVSSSFSFAEGVSTLEVTLTSIGGLSLHLPCEVGQDIPQEAKLITAYGPGATFREEHSGRQKLSVTFQAQIPTETPTVAPTQSPAETPDSSAPSTTPSRSPTTSPNVASAAPTASPTAASAAPHAASGLAGVAAAVLLAHLL